MASLILRGGSYYAQYHDATRSPVTKRFSLKTKRRDVARRLLTKFDRAFEVGAFDPWVDDPFGYDQTRPGEVVALRTAVEAFLADRREVGRKGTTLRAYGDVLGRLGQAVGEGVPVARLRACDLRAFVYAGDVSPATHGHRYRHVSAFVRWCRKAGWIKGNPLDDVERPRPNGKMPKHVTRQELERVCEAVQNHARRARRRGEVSWYEPLFRFAYFTGLRLSELGRLRWADVDVERRLIVLHEQKNGREQTVPFAEAALAVLAAMEMGERDDFVFKSPHYPGASRSIRAFGTGASKAFLRYRRDAGIERPLTFHGLRHGFCTALAEAGKSAIVIKEAARHAAVSTSMIYVHFANESLRAELNSVF
jgi:integrase